MQNRIKLIRKEAGLSQEAFAERIHLTRGFIAKVETGLVQFSPRTIDTICEKFNVNENWLMTGEGEMYLPKSRVAEVQDIAQKALEDTTPDKRERISNLITRVVGGMTDGEIDMLFELCKRHGYIKE